MEVVVRTGVISSSQIITNKPNPAFYRPDAIPVSEMTYTVSSGTLNTTTPHHLLSPNQHCQSSEGKNTNTIYSTYYYRYIIIIICIVIMIIYL